jgi:hypothetical protein
VQLSRFVANTSKFCFSTTIGWQCRANEPGTNMDDAADGRGRATKAFQQSLYEVTINLMVSLIAHSKSFFQHPKAAGAAAATAAATVKPFQRLQDDLVAPAAQSQTSRNSGTRARKSTRRVSSAAGWMRSMQANYSTCTQKRSPPSAKLALVRPVCSGNSR